MSFGKENRHDTLDFVYRDSLARDNMRRSSGGTAVDCERDECRPGQDVIYYGTRRYGYYGGGGVRVGPVDVWW
jgi:hypothetical protein